MGSLRRADPAGAEEKVKPYPCFACGSPMDMSGILGYCISCEVMEKRESRVCWTQDVRSQEWDGGTLEYVDFSRGWHPHP